MEPAEILTENTAGGSGLRKGFSTGSTSAAAVKASIRYYFEDEKFNSVEIKMPGGENASLKVASLLKFKLKPDAEQVISKSVLIKDSGGDFADVTGGIEICADFTVIDKKDKNAVKSLKKYYEKFLVYSIIKCPLCAGSTIIFVSSKGIGTVKRKGLPVKAGYPAINPVPYKMIESAAEEELNAINGVKDGLYCGGYDVGYGGKIFFSVLYVPEGEKIAERTLNPRLGIEGGISILGTSGYVVPISTKAWLETIKACLSFLKANKIDVCVFTPGRFSEKAASKIFKNFRRESFIEIGDYVSYSLRKVCGTGIKNIIFAGQFGKIVKIAQGARNTNAKYTSLDLGFLAETAKEAVKKRSEIDAERIYGLIIGSNTSREAFGHITSDDFNIYSDDILSKLLKKAAEKLYNIVKNADKDDNGAGRVFEAETGADINVKAEDGNSTDMKIDIEIVLIDYGGNEIKRERL